MLQQRVSSLRCFLGYILVFNFTVFQAARANADDPQFRVHLINAASEFSSAAAIDINRDGKLDIVSGAYWYESPNWNKQLFRDIAKINGRYDDYSNLPLDVDRDGNIDIVSVNYRSKSIYWSRNPGSNEGNPIWKNQLIDEPGTSETGRLVDIDGDGNLDLLPNGTSYAAWYAIDPNASESQKRFKRHELPSELMGHGVGAGDVNGDGRIDIVCPNGWAEGPSDPRTGRWLWHPEFKLARDCGLPILCTDVDGDGDTDLIWSRGHNIGLYWTEQVGPEDSAIKVPDSLAPAWDKVERHVTQPKWITHAIDTSWSSAHTLMFEDIDGDGRKDLITGKRYLGHDGKDPGENDPLQIYWYRFQPKTKTWSRHLITQGGLCGMDLDSASIDLDGDGDIDILAPTRIGLHWIENLRIDKGTIVDTKTDQSQYRLTLPNYPDHIDVGYVITGDQKKRIETPLDHGIRRWHAMQQMTQAMGDFPSCERRTALAIEIMSVDDTEKYTRIKLTYSPEPGDRVPSYLLIPRNIEEPKAAMLCLHPTHFELGKAQLVGLGGRESRHYAHELAELGFVCLVPDYPGFADYQYDFEKNSDLYASGTMKAIWNNIRGIDLLESLPCVNRDRIGAIGHSLGGHNTLYTAAFDQRIKCAVTSCGFNAFEDYYEGNLKGWSSLRYMPRIETKYHFDPKQMPFNFPEVLVAIAPRNLFVCAPERDANFAVRGVRTCQTSITPIYKLLGAEKNVRFEYPDAEHDFPDETRLQAYSWLVDRINKK
jgi:FG-GAP-like repeat/Prolyl oligopeptidase family